MYKKSVKIAVVDDHPIVIEGMKALFANEASSYDLICFDKALPFLDFLNQNKIDVVLLDIALPDMNGVEVCKIILEKHPLIKVIALSNQAEQSTILQMLNNGAVGFLLKSVPSEEILSSIQNALNNKVVMNSEIQKIITTTYENTNNLPSLTKRETQILHLLSQGKTTVMIADELFLSKFTIDTYRKNLLQKFEVKNTSELLILLYKNNLIKTS
ncbi:response regulator transcription factor [Flavobacterium sp. xlx-214]|uniref:response regulator n=1 Tax=unclassified Flavobacterium TaxID=196869 RepID=UPI0013D01053|nr:MULTISPECIES: response regulator transcription factor [unclassified Flavobacterium]MBA5793284.1 response regulator transcription factor [Flavobacterium sp. xlx-221]QMI84151.1 response regulator transcription factor [Flavobacterium sp. xlx-214]